MTSPAISRDQEKLGEEPEEAAVLYGRPGLPEGTHKIKGPAAH